MRLTNFVQSTAFQSKVQMEVKGNGSQQQHFNHRLSPVASAVVPISDHSSFDNYMDTEDRTGAFIIESEAPA